MNHDKHEGREVDEGDEDGPSLRYQMRRSSPLSPEAERAMTKTIGCAIGVHKSLGPGLLESIYRKAMYVELTAAQLLYEMERPVCITYRGVDLRGQRVDLIVEGLIVVELKSVARFSDVHRAQVISYLRATGLRGGLLINFNVPKLRDGLRRIVL